MTSEEPRQRDAADQRLAPSVPQIRAEATSDVIVIGAGPAAWAAAAALCRENLGVTLVAPDPSARFHNLYGVWVDELEGLGFDAVFERVWTSVDVHLAEDDRRQLGRAYARLDNVRLREELARRAGGVRLRKGLVERVELDLEERYRVVLAGGGGSLSAAVVIDASGHGSALIEPGQGPEAGWQVAYGRRIEVDEHPFDPERAVLMDFRMAEESVSARSLPSFIYVLPESSSTIFVEETSLVSRPPASIDELERRLDVRLARLGIQTRRVLAVERCYIPMGGPAAPPSQPVVAFGGAARMVHPASGYLIGRVLRSAPRLAQAARESLEAGDDLESRAVRMWDAVWSREARAAHDLYRFGTEILLDLDTPGTQSFFAAFFSLPERQWRTYLSGTAAPPELHAAMMGVFARAGWGLKARLVSAGLSRKGGPFRRTLFARG